MIKIKKGAAHIDVIISFIIFLTFVVFILVFFNPLKKYSASTAPLDAAEAVIIKATSIDVTTVSLSLNTSSTIIPGIGGCASIQLPLANPIAVIDENGDSTNADRSGNRVNFVRSFGKFFKIYSSEELVENTITAPCNSLTANDYTLGIQKTEKKIAYSKLLALNYSYSNDYAQLKEDLNLTNNFNVGVRIGSEYLFKTDIYKPKNVEAMARDVSIEILDENGNLIPAMMNIQTWK